MLVIDEHGGIETLYSDDLHDFGKVHGVARASHVEPTPEGWTVRLSQDLRLGEHRGAVLPGVYMKRNDALQAEEAFLVREVFNKKGSNNELE